MNTQNMQQENNWDKLKSKIQAYSPDEYSPADWKEMEALLKTQAPPIKGLRGKAWKWPGRFLTSWGLLLLASVTATALWLNYSGKTSRKAVIQANSNQVENAGNVHDAPLQTTENAAVDSSQQLMEGGKTAIRILSEKFQSGNSNAALTSGKPDARNKAKTGYPSTVNSNGLEGISRQENLKTGKGSSLDMPQTADESPVQNGQPIPENPTLKFDSSANTDVSRNNLEGLSMLPTLEFSGLETNPNLPDMQELIFPKSSIRKPFSKKIRMGAVLGVNNSIVDYEQFETSHFPFLGLFAFKRISPRWEAQVEAHIKSVYNFDLEQTFYSFDYFNGHQSLGSRTRHYQQYASLEFPFCLKYTVNRRLGLIAGGRLSFISDGYGGKQNHFFSDTKEAPFNGFWNKDFGLIAGMEYYVRPRWLLDLRWTQGFRDLTPDDLYGGDSSIHLNSDLQFSLRYIF